MYIPRVFSNKDTTYTKLFVGGLPYHTTDKTLHEHFEVFGEIEEAVVITNRVTGESKGYGFVTMAETEAAVMACKDANPIIDGRKANVNLAFKGAKPRVLPTAATAAIASTISVPATQYGYPQYIYQPAYMTSPGMLPTAFRPPTTVAQVTQPHIAHVAPPTVAQVPPPTMTQVPPPTMAQVPPPTTASPPTTQCIDYAALQQQYAEYYARVTAANQLTSTPVTCPHGNVLNSVRYMLPSYGYYLPQTTTATAQAMAYTGQMNISPSAAHEVPAHYTGGYPQVHQQANTESDCKNTQEIVLEEMKQ